MLSIYFKDNAYLEREFKNACRHNNDEQAFEFLKSLNFDKLSTEVLDGIRNWLANTLDKYTERDNTRITRPVWQNPYSVPLHRIYERTSLSLHAEHVWVDVHGDKGISESVLACLNKFPEGYLCGFTRITCPACEGLSSDHHDCSICSGRHTVMVPEKNHLIRIFIRAAQARFGHNWWDWAHENFSYPRWTGKFGWFFGGLGHVIYRDGTIFWGAKTPPTPVPNFLNADAKRFPFPGDAECQTDP